MFQQLLRKTSKRYGNRVLKAYCCLEVLENPITHTRTCSKSSQLGNKCSRNKQSNFICQCQKCGFLSRNRCQGGNTLHLFLSLIGEAWIRKRSYWIIKWIFFVHYGSVKLYLTAYFVQGRLTSVFARVSAEREQIGKVFRSKLFKTTLQIFPSKLVLIHLLCMLKMRGLLALFPYLEYKGFESPSRH